MANIRIKPIKDTKKKNEDEIRIKPIVSQETTQSNVGSTFNLPQNIKNNITTAQQLVQQRAAEQAQRDAESKRIVSLPFKSNSIVAIDKDRERMQKDADIILKNNQKFATLANQVNLKDKKGGTLPQLKYNDASEPLTLGEKIAYGMKDTFLGEAADEVAGVGWNVGKAVGELGEDLLDAGLQLGTSDLNPMYLTGLYDKKAQQDIAKELIQKDATQNAIEAYGLKGAQDYVNENSALFNEDSLGGTVVREATKILLESQLAPSMPGATKGTKLFSKAGLKQFGRSAAGIGGTMGISAYGNALEQAYNNGATREQASKYALMSSALEVATEMMFAGLGGFKGQGALDDVVQSKIASKYGNKLKGKILSKVADVLGEETEELVSWGIDPLLQKMTYAADQELGDLYDLGELGDTFTQTALSVLLLGCLPSNAEDSRKRIREQYVDYYMESHEGATKKEAKEALKRLEKEAERVSKQVEKAEKQQKGLFKNINEEVSSKGSSNATLSLEEIIRNVDPEKAKEIDKMKEQKEAETTEEVKEEKPTEESKVKTSLTELVEETTPKTEQQETEQPKKDFNTQVKDIAKQYNVDANTLKSSGIKDIDKIETIAKAMNKQNYNTTVKDLAKKYGVGVSVLKSTKITDAKELESVAKTLSTKTEAEIEAPKKAKELPKKETKQIKKIQKIPGFENYEIDEDGNLYIKETSQAKINQSKSTMTEKDMLKDKIKQKTYELDDYIKKNKLTDEGGLNSESAKVYKKIHKEMTDMIYELETKHYSEINENNIKDDRKTGFDKSVYVKARKADLKNKNIYDALTDSAAGAGLNQTTAIDDILLGKNEKVSADELYDTFNDTRSELLKKYGDTLTLYRVEGKQMSKPTKNYGSSIEYTKQYGDNVKEYTIPTKNVVAIFTNRTGRYEDIIVADNIDKYLKDANQIMKAKAQTKTQNKNQLFESAKYFNEQASTSGAKFNIKNSDIQKALDSYVQYKEAGGKKTIENLEKLRQKPSVVKKAKENEEKTKKLPKKEQTTKEEFASRLTSIMNTQKEIDDELSKDRRLPKAISVENTQTKKTEKTEKVAKETKKTIKPVKEVEEAKTTKKAESLPKTDEQIDAEIKEMAQKGVTTTKADINTRQMFMESRARTLDRQISNMRSSGNAGDINTFIDNNIKQYDQLLADGGKKIPAYEEFKAKYQPKKEEAIKTEANKVIENLGEKVTIAAASNRSNVKVIKDIDKALNKKSKNIDKPLNIADVAESLTSNTYSDDIADIPKNSEILTEFKKLPNKKSQVDEDIIAQAKAWLINQQAAIEKMDRKNRNYEGEQALARYKVSPGEGAAQVTNAQTDLDGKVVGKSIVQMEQEYYNGLSPEAKQIFGYWVNLQRDIGFRENSAELSEDIDSEYASNIFTEYSLEQEKQMVNSLEKAYPGLANHIETMFKDLRTYYRNENANLVKSGILSKTKDVPVKYAKNRMGMTDEQIAANRNKDGSVKVDTVDYLAAMNPYYFHVVRDVDRPSGNTSTTKTSVSVKGPQGLKEGAERYAIQPLFDGMADGAVKNREAMSLNQLLATIAKNDKTFENNQIPPTDLIEIDENGNEKIVKMGNDYYIKYRENGKNKAAKINKSMYDAISNNMTFVDKLFNVKVLKQYKQLNSIEKQLLTTLNPDFLIKNTARDLGEALLNTNYSDAVFVPEYIKSVWDIVSNNEEWQLFKNSGLYQSDGYFQYSKKDGITKQNPVARNTIGRMENIAAISEALPRFTEFKLALKKGESLNEAIRQAKRVTVDFSRRGKAFAATDRNFSKFVGAAQAGMNTMYDNIIGNNLYSAQTIMRKLHGEELTSRDIQTLKKSGRTLARIAMSSMIPSLYNSLAFGGDDDKEWLENNVPEYIKNNAYIIRIGKNTYIPLYYARSQSVYKKAFDEMLNKDSLGDKIGKITESFKENIAPNNPFETSTLNNVSKWFKNEDYYGNKIYEDDDTLLEKMRKVGRKEASSYGSLVYDVYDWATSSEKDSPSKIPIVNTLVKDTNTLSGVKQQSYNYSTKFWNKHDEYENSKDEKKNIIAKSMKADYKEYVKPIADKIKIAKETGASDKELKKLYTKQRDTYRSILEDEDDVYEYTGGYYYKGKNYKYTVDKNGKVSYRKQK